MAYFIDKHFIERAQATLLLGVLWGGLAACVLAALIYDISFWLAGW
jgi:hypothetical protein